MNDSFGARLRAQREQRQVGLGAIAEQTKIRLPLLEELERDNVSHWPHGIFRRAYLRAYAEAIGLNPDDTLREFLDLYPDLPEEPNGVPNGLAHGGTDAAGKRPGTRLHYMLGSAISALPHIFRGETKDEPADTTVRSPVATPVRRPDPPVLDGFPRNSLPVETHTATAPAAPPAAGEKPAPAAVSIDLGGVAEVCTRLSRAQTAGEVAPILADAVRLLDAVGLILWMWDPAHEALRPSLSHGYSRELLVYLPQVRSDADNAIASAFRTGETSIVPGSELATGAIVIPLFTPGGCGGVLALEVPSGHERHPAVCAVAAILAAQLSTLVEPQPMSLLRSATA
jgi:transcriptional regulator with XRE-family HTH domain